MNLKSAAFLALAGTILAAMLLVVGFISDVLNLISGLIPAVKLVTSFIYAFASVSVAAFFYVFHRAQS